MSPESANTIAVVVQYGPIPALLECLEHLLCAGTSLSRVIVVDNGPGDAPRGEAVNRQYPDVQYHLSLIHI